MNRELQLTDSLPAKAGSDSLPLFPFPADLPTWERDPEASFEAWLARPDFSRESARVYSSMWGKFTAWRRGNDVPLAGLKPGHIDRFLNDAKLVKHHRYRYVRLIERVYQDLARSNPGLGNPGSLAARQKIGEGSNDPMAYLRHDQRSSLIDWISQDLSGKVFGRKDEKWKAVRDLAVVSVMLGGGAKVSEARTLSVNCVSPDRTWLSVGEGVDAHKTRLMPFALPVLERWLDLRSSMRIPGTWLFVSGEDGRQMDETSLYRRAKLVMSDAGLKLGARESPQTLRNSFAAMLVELEIPDDVAAGYLGLQDGASFDRLRGRLIDAARRRD